MPNFLSLCCFSEPSASPPCCGDHGTAPFWVTRATALETNIVQAFILHPQPLSMQQVSQGFIKLDFYANSCKLPSQNDKRSDIHLNCYPILIPCFAHPFLSVLFQGKNRKSNPYMLIFSFSALKLGLHR